MPSTQIKHPWRLWFGLALLLSGGVSQALAGTATHFHFVAPSSPAGLYSVVVPSNSATFVIHAEDSGNVVDTTFNNRVVNVGLYNTVNPPLKASDPNAVIVESNGATLIGSSVPVTFILGVASFGVTFKAGSDSEQIYLQDTGGSPVTNGNTYPGVFAGAIGGAAITVRGFMSQPLIPIDADFDALCCDRPSISTPVSYFYPAGPNDSILLPTDPLIIGSNGAVSWGESYGDIIPPAAGAVGSSGVPASASCYVFNGFSGGYAAGGAGITFGMYLASAFGNQPVTYQAILDYSGAVTDYNNPPPSATVWQGTANAQALLGNGLAHFYTGGAPVGGFQSSFQPFMTNGKVILRLWTNNSIAVTLCYTTVASSQATALSYIQIPYSPSNVQPLLSTVTSPSYTATPSSPPVVLGGYPVTLVNTFNNQFNSPLTQIVYRIPPNSVGGSDWNFTSVNTGRAGCSPSVTSNPSGLSIPGTITVDFGAPMTVNENVAITMIGTSSSESNTWPISILSANTNLGSQAPWDTTSAFVITLGVPSIPGPFSASVANYINSGGGRADLDWTSAVLNQGANGYIISRRSPAGGGAFSALVTLGNNALTSYTDATASNFPTTYDYTIAATNPITQSGPATVSNIIPYTNPGPPVNVTALSGGTSVQLNWATPVAVSGSYPVTGYQIWRDTSPGMGTAVTIASVGLVTTYNDTTVSGGNTYYYRMSSMDSQYASGAPGGPHHSAFSSPIVSGFPPGNPPTGLTPLLTSVSPATINLSWAAPVSNIGALSNYIVYRGVNGPASSGYTVVSSLFSNDSGVVAGNYYVYKVAGIYPGPVTTNFSGSVTGVVVPSAPTGLAATAGTASISLSWTANSGFEGVTQYNLYLDGSFASSTAGTGPVLNSPSFGVTHVYRVSAVNAGGEGSLSAPVTTALLPNAPVGFTAAPDPVVPSNVVLTWATPVPAQPDILSYNVYRNSTNVFAGSTAITIGLPVTYTYTDTTQSPANAGQTFFYFLQAQNIGGAGLTAIRGQQVPPRAPTPVSASATGISITVNWTSPASEKASSYTIYRSQLPGGPLTQVVGTATPGTATSFSDGSAVLGVDYYYNVTATNPGSGATIVGGESLKSASVTMARKLGVPQSFTAASQAVVRSNVNLAWSAPAVSTNLTSYKIYRNTTAVLPGAPITTLSNAFTSLSDVTLGPVTAAGQTFFYFLEPQNAGGGGATSMVGLQIPPNPPVPLAASSTAATLTVNWTQRPGSENVSTYSLYRSLSSAGPFSSPLTTLNSPVGTFNDGIVSPGVTYYYKISATNPGGGAGIPGGESVLSSTVTIGLKPQIPTGLAAVTVTTTNDIPVTWANVTTVDSNATSLTLYTSSAGTTTGATLTQLTPASSVSFFDAGKAPDSVYSYWLQTNNAFGPSTLAGPVSQLTYPAPVVLNSVILSPDALQRYITWTPVGSGDVTSYNVYRQLQGSLLAIQVSQISATGLTFPVTLSNSSQPGKIYYYWVTGVNATGEGSSAATIQIGIPPSKPSGVTAVSGISSASSQVDLSWNLNDPLEGVASYTVYRSALPDSGYVSIGSTLSPVSVLSDPGLTPNQAYYYIVDAVDASPAESVFNTVNAVAVTAYALPAAATGVTAVAGNGQATVSWTPPSATTYPVSIFNVYRVSGGVTTPANPSSAAASPLTDTGLTNGNSYFYLIKTMDTLGHLSVYSSPSITIQPQSPPNAPTGMGVVNGDKAVQVSWSPAVPGTLPVGSYLIFRQSPPGTGPITQIAQVGASLTGYVDTDGGTGLTNLTSYSYWVQTVDNSGVTFAPHISGNSSLVTGTPQALNINPPGNVTGNAGNLSFLINWLDSYTPGAAVTGYSVWRSSTGAAGPYSAQVTVGTGVQTYNDVSVVNGTAYYYYLVAISTIPTYSSGSATIFGTPSAPPPPPAPISTLDGFNKVTLQWTASVGAGSVTIQNYVVYQAIPPGSAYITLGGTTGPVTSYLDLSPTNGNPAEYFVAAVNSNGTTGALSSPVTGFPYDLNGPVVSSASGSTGVTLNWSAPSINSYSPVTQYSVYRSTTSGVYNLSAPLSLLAGTSMVDLTATPGQLYYYVVTATDNQGHAGPLSTEIFDGSSTPPGPPTNVSTTPGSTEILVDWGAPVSLAGNLPVSFYILTRTSGAPVTLPASQTWYLDTGLVDPATVNYTIVAVDASGPGQMADPAHAGTTAPGSGTTDSTLINPPTNLTAKAAGTTVINLAWTPSNDLGRLIQSYAIYRSSSLPVPTGSPLAVVTNSLAAPTTVFSDTTASQNSTYYYVVQSVEQGTNAHSGNSNHASDTTAKSTTPPIPVTVGQMGLDANLFLPLSGQPLGIIYDIPNDGVVEIDIYNVAGNPIATLVPGMTMANTKQSVFWDGKDRNGNTVASGLYVVEIRAPGFHQLKKVAVVK